MMRLCPFDNFDMRKDTRSSYHKQIKFIRRNKNAIFKNRRSNVRLSKGSCEFGRSVKNV